MTNDKCLGPAFSNIIKKKKKKKKCSGDEIFKLIKSKF